jgi:RNA polymerase sigma-54 factor
MVLLQPRLNVRLSQKQILTPGLVQMVSVLALNKIELKDMINAEIMENPVLEELDSNVPLLDEVAGRDEERERETKAGDEPVPDGAKSDSFEEIDFGSFFQEYLDPGYRSPESEFVERPSFENFLSKPVTLTEHLMWQLGAMSMSPAVHEAAELVIGNLNEEGYLTASDEELMAVAAGEHVALKGETAKTAPEIADEPAAEAGLPDDASAHVETRPPQYPFLKSYSQDIADDAEADAIAAQLAAAGIDPAALEDDGADDIPMELATPPVEAPAPISIAAVSEPLPAAVAQPEPAADTAQPEAEAGEAEAGQEHRATVLQMAPRGAPFTVEELHEAIALIRQMDPIGVASRDLRECMLAQLQYLQHAHAEKGADLGANGDTEQVLADAIAIVDAHLKAVQNKQHKEIARAIGRPQEAVMKALDFLKTLDPRPGLRYNKVEPRLIEPDVAFVKQGEDFLIVLNDEDVPQLRLNPTYKRLLNRDVADKDTRGYVKERYKSAIQLIKNIEQRKQTIIKVCYAILGRQRDFLDKGIDQLKPMMIKDVAEEIGVHPSTVSRAVASKYAHTPQGVFELRYFFSESVNGPEGGGTSLLILKRRVKKLIEEEDPSRPLTDEQITRILQSQGIQVTRRTVAKYREDMKIPSTHQRRVKQ